MEIRNPLTGAYDYRLAVDSEVDITQKAVKLRQAQESWQKSGLEFRVEVLTRWLGALKEVEAELIIALQTDTGRKSIARIEAVSTEGLIRGGIYKAQRLLSIPAGRNSVVESSVEIQQQWVPYTLVGVISPWNFPLLLALIDTIPALLAGCTVLLKPSEVTPRFMDPLEKSIQAVPELDAVLKLARGGAETGKAVVQNADAICFTGSVPTGRKIAMACAERFIPAFLELGGKDPAVVLKDADLELSTDAVLRSSVGATGQACQALERIYVDDSIFENFLNLLVKKAKEVKLTAHPGKGQLGPIIFEQQAEKIQAQIDDAKAKGAKILSGGKVEEIGGGLWCNATVITGVTHDMQVMTEETFGPLIPVMPFKTEAEAIQLANDSPFGLSASVFSQDHAHAVSVAKQIEAGAISINDGSLTNKVFDAEKNSFKESGLNGSRMGDAGFLRFFRKKALLIQNDAPATMKVFEE